MKAILLGTAAALSLTAGAALAQSAAGEAELINSMVGGAQMFANQTIVQNAQNSPIHTTLVAAVVAADLVGTLSSDGPFTVFAPTDSAFDQINRDSLTALTQPENRAQLQQILTCHVVAGSVMQGALQSMIDTDGGTHPIVTVGGCTMQGSYSGDTLTLTDENGRTARVTIPNVLQSNGVIHVIDRVLLPRQ